MKIEKDRDAKGDWIWRCRAANGNIMADSGEGYRNEADLDRALVSLRASFAHAPVMIRNGDKFTDDPGFPRSS